MDERTVTSTGDDLAGAAEPRAGLPLLGARYRVTGMLGRGGMGNVYVAHDTELDEDVAVKLLKARLAGKRDPIEMLRREVKFARRVTHPNVLRTFDIGEHEGRKFVTMELVRGRTLADALAAEDGRPIRFAEISRIARALCAGLGAAHDAGVVHRDLKPSNVLLADDGRILIADFGIARLADDPEAGAFAGTPGYMAPELIANEAVDTRADVWSLGALLYELVTGVRAFGGRPHDIAQPLLFSPPDPCTLRPETPLALARAITRCLARAPEARFGHPIELGVAIGAALEALDRAPGASLTARGRRARTVAVLPFDGTGVEAHVTEGIGALLADGLDVPPLRVPSRAATAAARVAGPDPLAIARDLGAEAVVTGAVTRLEGGDVAISITARGTGDGLAFFAEATRGPASEIVRGCERLHRGLAHALLVERDAPANDLHDAEAIDLYLKGMRAHRGRWVGSAAEATEALRRAAERAPESPLILAGLALALARLASLGGTEAMLAEAEVVSTRALRLARDRPDPHVAVASVALQRGRNVEAAQALVDALAIAPHHAEAHHLRGLLSLETIGVAEGLAHFYTARTIDPGLLHTLWWIGRAHALAGESARADAIFAKPPEDEGASVDYWIARARAVGYDRTPARERRLRADVAAMPESATKQAIVAAIRASAGERVPTEELGLLAGERDAASRRRAGFGECMRAELAAVLGDDEAVVAALIAADAAGLVDVVWLDICPSLARVRNDPRFEALRARVDARAARVRAVLVTPRRA